MANFREEALYRQANFLGPVAKVTYSFRYPADEGLGVALRGHNSAYMVTDIAPVFDNGPPYSPWNKLLAATDG